ncbi:hypothetical protein COO60DRAFT_312524 [Scenedesmus sp. NREL 46B-D3]|nr:hypothetical protein COO60DRAFT_312524 [Scenedesmus sp. NREL 46B-D3]
MLLACVCCCQELLDWCNAWQPQTLGGQTSPKHTRTVCIAHQFGQRGNLHKQPDGNQAAAVANDAMAKTASLTNIAGTAAAAAAAVQGSIPPSASAAALQALSGSSSSSSSSSFNSSSGSAHNIGRLGRMQEALLEASGAVMGFLWRHSGTRNLLSMPTRRMDTAHAAAAAAARAANDNHFQQQTQQQRLPDDPSFARASEQQQQQPARHLAGAAPELPPDPELDPRTLLADVALLDETDVLVGLHGGQLFNALYMPAHKALVEVRPHQFAGGWPDTYFKQPLASDEKYADNGDGIFWFGIDTVNASNSKPGKWEAANSGCCHPRDRHTRIEPAALEYVLRWVKAVQCFWAGSHMVKHASGL